MKYIANIESAWICLSTMCKLKVYDLYLPNITLVSLIFLFIFSILRLTVFLHSLMLNETWREVCNNGACTQHTTLLNNGTIEQSTPFIIRSVSRIRCERTEKKNYQCFFFNPYISTFVYLLLKLKFVFACKNVCLPPSQKL